MVAVREENHGRLGTSPRRVWSAFGRPFSPSGCAGRRGERSRHKRKTTRPFSTNLAECLGPQLARTTSFAYTGIMDDPTATPSGQVSTDQPQTVIPAAPGQVPTSDVQEETRPDSTIQAEPPAVSVTEPTVPEPQPEPVPVPEPTRPDTTILAAPEPAPEIPPPAPPEPIVVQPSPPPPLVIPEPTINIEPVVVPPPAPEIPQPEPEIPPQPTPPIISPEPRMSTEELLASRRNDLQNQVDQALKLQLDQRRQKANQTRTDQRNERLTKIQQFVQSHGPINNQDVRDLLHVSQSTATDYLKSLVGRGILKMEKKSNFTTYH